ncbi:hypothetical protein QP568_06640 [Propionimicrobium lymphophilum]|uniref:Uncharacterized protein n=2 Tax=Propionimicrobium TaxID=203133 RepID=S2WL70_9ACTN|nr:MULTISPECIES: hypothetical protein [Propionimicrobium]EPD33392.1 hypothetical protein HMPREF9306_00932 [Propionimicrobium lymphophilum ACS-093-V-SCH5]MDK7709773.1 hypothetical protein [Propionimicrobium lymphophilum]MDK7733965.1 hypothetical protein [Propionimicrobium lymphophilum]
MAKSFNVDLDEAMLPLVLALDVEETPVDVGPVAKPRSKNAEHFVQLAESVQHIYANFYSSFLTFSPPSKLAV